MDAYTDEHSLSVLTELYRITRSRRPHHTGACGVRKGCNYVISPTDLNISVCSNSGNLHHCGLDHCDYVVICADNANRCVHVVVVVVVI